MRTDSLNFQLWPELKFEELKASVETLQLWTQIVGKIRLRNMPWLNHSWHVSLYISSRGLTTSSIPYKNGIFQIDFDFIDHQLIISSSTGEINKVELHARTVASFYDELFEKLKSMDILVKIYKKPNEVNPAIPFDEDEIHKSYDKKQVHNLWTAFVRIDTVFNRFRSRFAGKCSPVHLFWGAFDLAVTRFSGREAPKHQGGVPNIPPEIMQEAYSHEVSSAGFWPGNDAFPHPAFYAYCYPTPEEYGQQSVKPKEAFYSKEMGEFLLPYESVRQSSAPEETLMQFLQSTYDATVDTANWDKEALAFKGPHDK
ncbi:hypothetical protein H8S90_14640 [Olivibacter sp. SDN3]|uniref:DUF5996 family protein n=1 Tax=Olivibacter sp. SDN3 TaxID=2764720 RepID=UPI001650F616|nr:DUF5996 family protein [Olivibacter sp. SDN3]QNL48043.1 hypothetical protein H8S90_14640 [Olivibacter sp. SDN3]